MSTFDLIVRGGEAVLPDGVVRADIGVSDGMFAEIGAIGAGRGPEVDASGCHVLPGAIDAHVHFGVTIAGFDSGDGYREGSTAAVCGGVTTVGDFTVQLPGESLAASIERRLAQARGISRCDWFLHANVTSPTSEVIEEIPGIVESGVASFKLFLAYPGMAVGMDVFVEVLGAAGRAGGLAMVHAEDGALVREATDHLAGKGLLGAGFFFDSRPPRAEAEAIRMVGEASIETGFPVYVVHLSSRDGLVAARRAREGGARLDLETCPQYVLMERPSNRSQHPCRLACAPPLRGAADRSALTAAVASGEIDVLATDHCPFTITQKVAGRDDFRLVPGGLPGVETLFPLAYDLALSGTLGLPVVSRVLADTPARLFGIDGSKGAIRIGMDADFVIADPGGRTVVRNDALHSNTDFSPWEGRKLRGSIREVYLRGRRVALGDGAGRVAPVGRPEGRFRKARPRPRAGR